MEKNIKERLIAWFDKQVEKSMQKQADRLFNKGKKDEDSNRTRH